MGAWRAVVGSVAVVVAAALTAGCGSSSHARRLLDAILPGPYLHGGPPPHRSADEHWHAAIGVNVCGTWQPGPIWTTFTDGGSLARAGTNVYAGLHTHTLQDGKSDGLIHMEPATSEESGRGATVGRWLQYGGWTVTGAEWKLWPGADGRLMHETAGASCAAGPYAGRPIALRWALDKHVAGAAVHLVEQRDPITAYKLYDEDVIAMFAIPRDVPITGALTEVPSVANLSDPSSGEGNGHTIPRTTAPAAPPPGPPCPNAATPPVRAVTHTYAAPVDQHLDASRSYRATFVTTCGSFTVALDVAHAPKSVDNFVFLARAHFYDGLTFHRAVTDFVIQGGDPNGNGTGGPGYTVPTEPPATPYTIGDLAWAKTSTDLAGTAGSQFFVITGREGVNLPLEYGRFGHVVSGIGVAESIAALSTGDGPPRRPVYIVRVTVA